MLSVEVETRLTALDRLMDRSTHTRHVLEAVANVVRAHNARYIRTARYAPLKPRTIRQKRTRGRPARPLVGGDLERSLQTANAPFALTRLNRDLLVVGTKDPVANLHVTGNKRMPARPPVKVTPALRRQIRETLIRELLR